MKCSQGTKHYVDSEALVATDHGLFVSTDSGDLLPVPLLFSDKQGCYIEPIFKSLKTCPFCDKDYFVYCKTPKCLARVRELKEARKRERKGST